MTRRRAVRTCRECGCTDDDCRGCIERTGEPCHWVGVDLCSACVGRPASALRRLLAWLLAGPALDPPPRAAAHRAFYLTGGGSR